MCHCDPESNEGEAVSECRRRMGGPKALQTYYQLLIESQDDSLYLGYICHIYDAILIGVARQRHRHWGRCHLLVRSLTLSCKVCQ